MKAQRLVFRCNCGGYMRPATMYVTENREILFYGICDDCDQRVQIQDSLTALYKMACAISKMNRPVKPPLKALPLQTDANFLKSMGVKDD